MQSSGEDTQPISAEFPTTELPPTRLFDLPTVPFERQPGVKEQAEKQSLALPRVVPTQAVQTRPGRFRWSIVRWGTVAIAVAAIAQAGVTLFISVVAPTFARQIEWAQTRSAGVKISAMNQAQQVHFLDHGEFSDELVQLDLGIISQGQYYDYRIQTAAPARSRSRYSPETDVEIIVSLALPREPGLPTLWGAIAAQRTESSELGQARRIADSLICKKPAPSTDWSDKLRQQLQSESVKRRSREAVPVVPMRLECPPGFEPASFSLHA